MVIIACQFGDKKIKYINNRQLHTFDCWMNG